MNDSPSSVHQGYGMNTLLRGSSQQGFVLIVALIVLAAMALAAVALVRTVDTSTLLARNVSFKRDAINRTEIALQIAGAQFLVGGALASQAATEQNVPAKNFSATMLTTDARGVPTVLIGTPALPNTNFSVDPTSLPAEARSDGNKTYYTIERLCSIAGQVPRSPKDPSWGSCVSSVTTSRLKNTPVPASATYRVTALTTGVRNVSSYAQQIIVPLPINN
jgi:type IV pilus assembly protein PilX